VTMQNFGINQITSATINWKLNGVAQTPYNWTGLLDTLNASTRKTSVTLATMNFLSGIPYTIEAWTSMPNGVADTVNNNDTTVATRQSALSGTFTIGGANPDFPDFDAALTVLHDNGLCGPVVFNVRPGTYTEQVAIGGGRGTVSGTSGVNTVTFQSETGNRADVTVDFYSQTGNPTLYVNDTDWLIFRNMTFTASNPTYSIVFYYLGGMENCMFENIDFIGQPVLTTSTNNTVIYSPSGSLDHNNSFLNCTIQDGSYGMYLYGSGTASTENNTLIQNCRFTGQYYRPFYAYYLGETKFLDNTIIQEGSTIYAYRYPAAFYYGFNSQIERNVIFSSGGTYAYGVYFYYENYYQSGSSRFVNNMISIVDCPNAYYSMYAYRM
jgi:parallel beta-helix repeat protein